MKIILCGYHWTGCEALRQLLSKGHQVFVYTHESPSHVPSLVDYCAATKTEFSLENISKSNLPFKPDCIASIYYRYIIKPWVIEESEGRIFNLHPSLLPAYRGCSSLTWAMIEGQQETGFTYHYVDEGCDTGRIILQEKLPIFDFDTQETLYVRACTQAMEHFPKALQLVLEGNEGIAQTGEVSYFPRGCPYDGEIDPEWPDAKIRRFIRAMIYPPYPPASLQGEEIRSWEDYVRSSGQA